MAQVYGFVKIRHIIMETKLAFAVLFYIICKLYWDIAKW